MHKHEEKKLNFLALAIEIFPGHAFSSNISGDARRAAVASLLPHHCRRAVAAAAKCSVRYIDFLKEKRGA